MGHHAKAVWNTTTFVLGVLNCSTKQVLQQGKKKIRKNKAKRTKNHNGALIVVRHIRKQHQHNNDNIITWARRHCNNSLTYMKTKPKPMHEAAASLLLQTWFRGAQKRQSYTRMRDAVSLFYFPDIIPPSLRPVANHFAVVISVTIQRVWRGYACRYHVETQVRKQRRVKFVRANKTIPTCRHHYCRGVGKL